MLRMTSTTGFTSVTPFKSRKVGRFQNASTGWGWVVPGMLLRVAALLPSLDCRRWSTIAWTERLNRPETEGTSHDSDADESRHRRQLRRTPSPVHQGIGRIQAQDRI